MWFVRILVGDCSHNATHASTYEIPSSSNDLKVETMDAFPVDADAAQAGIEAAIDSIERKFSAKPLAGWARLTKLCVELPLKNWVQI